MPGARPSDVPPHAEAARAVPPPAGQQAGHEVHVPVVPKGLRSFDANDSNFFLQLLPGPRDQDGLPESIRFWKHRIEDNNDLTFTVGVIYGPSGCGKSSLVKAGLLPASPGESSRSTSRRPPTRPRPGS